MNYVQKHFQDDTDLEYVSYVGLEHKGAKFISNKNTDMVINVKKSCCLRCNVACRPLSASSGVEIPWKNNICYLGAFVVQCRKFKCCLDDAKSHYHAANAVFGKIGRIVSEEVILEIIRRKCIPILLYGTEAFMLNKSEFCQDQFGFDKPSVLWARRVRNLDSRFVASENAFCKLTLSL